MSVPLFRSAGRGPRGCGWALGSERLGTTTYEGLPRSVLIRTTGGTRARDHPL